jgi:hypothetical protein
MYDVDASRWPVYFPQAQRMAPSPVPAPRWAVSGSSRSDLSRSGGRQHLLVGHSIDEDFRQMIYNAWEAEL